MAGSILLIFVLIALNGFFVSVEFAAVASRRARVQVLADAGNRSARLVQTWQENPAARDRLIAGSQLGITIVSLALGAIGENTVEELLAPYFEHLVLPASLNILSPVITALPLIISLIVITSLHVVLGEQVPKVAALHDPERFAMLSVWPMRVFTTTFKWFVDLLDWVTRQILRVFGLQMVGEHLTVYTIEELKQILTDSEEGGVIQSPEHEMLDAIFDLNALVARHVMTPRTEVIAVEADALLDEIIAMVTQSSLTKFPVYEDNLDQIVGVMHVKDLLKAMQSPDSGAITARSLAREPIFAPETISISALLQQFRDNRSHIAIVLDEYGGTAGLVTLEDLLEEIVGEISDPFDRVNPQIQTMPDGTAQIDGLALIEEVNEHLELELQDPDYDTIAGYVLGRLGRIPRTGDTVESQDVRLKVESMDGMRISRLSLTRLSPPEESPPSA